MKNFQVQPWFYAKIILFLVLLSSLMKAFKKDNTILLAQRRAGLVISAIAFVAIIILVIVKPVLLNCSTFFAFCLSSRLNCIQ